MRTPARATATALLTASCLVASGCATSASTSTRGGEEAPPATFAEVPGDLERLERQITCTGYSVPTAGQMEQASSLEREAIDDARRLLASRLAWTMTDAGPVGHTRALDLLAATARVVQVQDTPDGARRATVTVGLLEVRAALEEAGIPTPGLARRFDPSRFATSANARLDPAAVDRALGPPPTGRATPNAHGDVIADALTLELATPWRASVPAHVAMVEVAGSVRAARGIALVRAARAGSTAPAALELPATAPTAASFALEVPLAPGPNELHVVVRDAHGNAAGWRVEIDRAR